MCRSRSTSNNETILWSIQTELERDRDRERDRDQYYADSFTLQWERDQDQELTHLFTCPK